MTKLIHANILIFSHIQWLLKVTSFLLVLYCQLEYCLVQKRFRIQSVAFPSGGKRNSNISGNNRLCINGASFNSAKKYISVFFIFKGLS